MIIFEMNGQHGQELLNSLNRYPEILKIIFIVIQHSILSSRDNLHRNKLTNHIKIICNKLNFN